MYCLIVVIFSAVCCLNEIQSLRLSRLVTPVHYTIHIQPDFEQNIFYGKTLVYVYTKSTIDEIFLHSLNLNISAAYINTKTAIVRDEDYEKISVRYENETIQPGLHQIFFNFTGIINEASDGFFKAPFGYDDEDVYVYVTDLEPANARKIFPCFDEPYFKARFHIKLVAPAGYEAISNMPEINKFSSSRGTIYTFQNTVKMSTYLVSFAFTNFPYYEDKIEENGNSWPIRVYSLNASKENNEYAIECTKNALKFYSKYTNISYPLPKLDMIEYERNQSAATENWGLITFRKGLLSPNLKLYHKSQIELVVYHELSHFWFGNLVTNDWWNDLWLQEGFAVYLSYKLSALQNNITQLKNMQDFQYDFYLEIEYTNKSRPVVSHISKSDDIANKFDHLVYDKGAAVLLMLEGVIGEEKFQLCIQTFLKKFAYQTATTNDFITVVEEIVPHLPIRSFLESFLYQNKFPIISVENINGTFVLKQEVCQSPTYEPLRNKWTIPISYITDKDNQTKLVWFDRDMDTLEIVESDIKWIVFNPKGSGMYKTQFLSASMWRNLIKNFESFDKEVAEAVVSNAVYLFKFNLINCDIIINFIKEIKKSTNLSIFGTFNGFLLESFSCSGRNDTANVYWKFLMDRYNATSAEKRRINFHCRLSDMSDSIEIGESLQQCEEWILDHLDETSNDVIKHVES